MSQSFTKLSAALFDTTSTVTPETCDLLGNKAAQLAIDANIPLSDAVVKVAHDQPGLNNTHITNICQFANNEYFRKVAAARSRAGENLVFSYELADPSEVTKQVNSEAQPKVSHLVDADYLIAPTPKTDDEALKVAFRAVGPPKVAQVNTPVSLENPIYELGTLRQSAKRVADEAQDKVASLTGHILALEAKLYTQFKQAALSDIPASHIAHLWEQHEDGPVGAAQELKKVALRLAAEDPLVYKRFTKTAEVEVSGRPDLTHELYDTYSSLRTLRGELDSMRVMEKAAQADYEFVLKAEERGMQMFADRIAVKRIVP